MTSGPETSDEIAISPAWGGVSGIFGGQVIALLARGAQSRPETSGLALASLHVEFGGTVHPGAARLEVEVAHRGRSTATVRTTLSQGRELASGVAKLVRPGERSITGIADLRDVPPVERVPDFVAPYGELSYADHFDLRVFSHGAVDGVWTTKAWVRAHQGAGLGAGGTEAALLDIVPPGLFFADPTPAFVPTVDFSLHRRPYADEADLEGQWLVAQARTEWSDDQFCAETATLHDARGRFVARATQTRRIGW